MVLAGRTSWNLPKTDATNKWCLAWRDGLQPRILVIEGILHLAMATWHSSLPLMVVMVSKVVATVGTEETEKIKEITEIAQIMEIATLMVVEPTSIKMLDEDEVEKEANPEIQLGSHPLRLGNSPFLTSMDSLFMRR